MCFCHIYRLLLVSNEHKILLILLVLGERVGEAAQQNEDQRKEAMVYIYIYILFQFTCLMLCTVNVRSSINCYMLDHTSSHFNHA